MLERGIVVNGQVLAQTDRVMREADAWWRNGERGTMPRGGLVADRLVGHWTAGNPRTGPTSGRRVVSAMKARKKPNGDPLQVAIHFVIGWDGLIWQTADLGIATVHVGNRRINACSVGVECCWPGTVENAKRLGCEVESVTIGQARGVRVRCMTPSPELLEAWRWLSDALVAAHHPAVIIPRQKGTMTRPGVMEHCDVVGTTKVDAAGLLIAAAGVIG
jgi:hypothetical protein